MMKDEFIPLAEIVDELENGSRPEGGVNDSGDIFSVGGEHLNDYGGFDFSSVKLISHDFYNQMKRGKVKPDDIIIVKDGATTGKTSFVNEQFPHFPCAINEHVFRLAVNQKIADPRYIFYYLYSSKGNKEILDDFRGATVGGISQDFVNKVFIPLPPLTEQKRIASLLARADRLRHLRRTAHDLGDSVLQSVFLEMFGNPETNPKKWKVGHVRDLCEKILDCPHETPVHSETETEYASIRSSDIQNGHLDFSTTKYVSYEVYKRRIARGTPMPGDIVYCREGARFGNAARIPENLNKKICLGQRMMSFRVNPQKATSEFLWAILESPSIYKQAANMVGGSAAPHVNVQDIKKFNIILPPLSLQEEFAGVVARVESLRGRMSEGERQVEGLFESLLAEAFSA